MSIKKQNILSTAGILFNEFGFVNIGVDRIITESNVAKMTFYKHFPSKKDLINEVLRERDFMIRRSILNKIELASDNRLGKLSALFDWYSEWFSSPSFFGCLFVKANDELVVDTLITNIIHSHKKWMTNLILDILTEMNELNAKNKAVQIMIILDGSIVNESINKDKSTIKQAWEITRLIIQN